VIDVEDGLIIVDSTRGNLFDFTSFRYEKHSYLWLQDGYVMVSFIETVRKGNGDFSKLIKKILKAGFGVKVPTPLGIMESILKKKGFKKTYESDEHFAEDVEVWVLESEVKSC
jgi:hypothetical protein